MKINTIKSIGSKLSIKLLKLNPSINPKINILKTKGSSPKIKVENIQ